MQKLFTSLQTKVPKDIRFNGRSSLLFNVHELPPSLPEIAIKPTQTLVVEWDSKAAGHLKQLNPMFVSALHFFKLDEAIIDTAEKRGIDWEEFRDFAKQAVAWKVARPIQPLYDFSKFKIVHKGSFRSIQN